MAPTYDRTTPIIALRIKLPGKASPERVPALQDLPGNASRVISLTFEDNDKAIDKASLIINNYDLVFPDNPVFDRGNVLYLQWGYPGNLAPERELVIVDWTPGPKFKVDAHARAASMMNRYPVDQTWHGKLISDVVAEIAQRNGFGPSVQQITPTSWVNETIVQANMTDGQFVRSWAKELGWVFFVDGSGFHFHPRADGQKPRLVLEYFPKDRGMLIDFPAFEKAPAAQPGSVTKKGIDPITKKPIEVRADNESTKGRQGLAHTIEVIDKKTATTALRPFAGREAVQHTGALSPAEATAKAKGLYQRATGLPVRCTAPCWGDPQFQAKSTVELRGIGQRLSGVYYCPQAVHSVEAGKYTMAVKLVRDGTNGAAGLGSVKSDAKTNDGKGTGDTGALQGVDTIDPRTGQTTTTFKSGGPTK